jgi:flavin-dependent dehydrogenase
VPLVAKSGEEPWFDVAVIGAGPAGSSCALRLAQFGYRVALFDKGDSARQHVGESLPSSIRVVFSTLGLEVPEDAVVARPAEHLVYWGEMAGGGPSSDAPGHESSFLVWREPFDRFLAASAAKAGATVIGAAVRGIHRLDHGFSIDTGRESRTARRARFLVDASGRAGLFERTLRKKEKSFRTLALTSHFQTEEKSPPTLIEAFEDGWVWSAPLRNGLRDVTVMLDAPAARGHRRALQALFARSIESAPHARRLVEGAPPHGPLRGIDSTPYRSETVCGPDYLLAGDAASFLDPLSGHGVHKAMDGALAAAAVVRTILERPERAQDALAFYSDRERRIAEITSERLRTLYGQESRFSDRAFWRKRSSSHPPPPEKPPIARPPLDSNVPLRAARDVAIADAPVLEGDFIERRAVLIAPFQERPVRFLGAVSLPDLFRDVIAAPSASEAASRSPFGFETALAAIAWLYRSGYLERRDEAEL